NGATRGSAKSFFIIPGVRVVFALGLLLPGGAALNRPTKPFAPATAAPPGSTSAVLFLRWCIAKHAVSYKQKPPHHNKNKIT
ncbi:hypothetical protein, partial [Enterobacter hormaechei]